jgi:acyl carrier protein
MFPSPDEEAQAKLAAAALKTGPASKRSEPRHARPSSAGPYVAPGTAAEEQLAAIWEQVFGIERIGTQDDFFALGGESLLALQIVNRIRDAFGTEVSIREFFERPSIAGVAALLVAERDDTREAMDAIVPRAREAHRLGGSAREAVALSVKRES